MTEIITKAVGYIAIIAIAYTLKRTGVVKRELSAIFTKILMWFTLPCAVITSFSKATDVSSFFILPLVALVLNWIMEGVGFLIAGKKSKEDHVLYMTNMAGYNLGAFTMPFVQGFLTPNAVASICMFDAGNAIMCVGGIYAVGQGYMGGKPSARTFIKSLFSSVPFDVYLLILVFAFTGVHIPGEVVGVISPIAGANAFVAMFTIGLLMEFDPKPEFHKRVLTILAVRYAVAIICVLLLNRFSPFEKDITHALMFALFAPIPNMSSVYCEKLGSRSDISGYTTSLTFIISMVCMTSMAIMFNGF